MQSTRGWNKKRPFPNVTPSCPVLRIRSCSGRRAITFRQTKHRLRCAKSAASRPHRVRSPAHSTHSHRLYTTITHTRSRSARKHRALYESKDPQYLSVSYTQWQVKNYNSPTPCAAVFVNSYSVAVGLRNHQHVPPWVPLQQPSIPAECRPPPPPRERVTTRGVEGKNAASGNENHPHLTLAPALPLNIL